MGLAVRWCALHRHLSWTSPLLFFSSPHVAVFRDERQRILDAIERNETPEDYKTNSAAAVKRLDGKRTGAAKFQAMARTVAARWSALKESDKEPFQKMAKEEMERYKV